jgi:hypothetical protein
MTWAPAAPASAQDTAPTAGPATVTVTAQVEPERVTIGTPFRYTMRVEASGEAEVIVPILADRIGDFVITDFGDVPPRIENGQVVTERWYTLVTYETGDLLVPGPTVQYRTPGGELQSVDAKDTLVIVESLLAKGEGAGMSDVADIAGPVAVPRDYRPLWWGGATAVALAAAAYALSRLLNRRRGAAAPPSVPAHELALAALAHLRAARLLEGGRHEEYYVRLSSIVRTYLEGRFHLRAPEMTTEEFLQAAQRDPQLAPAHRASLSQFLGEADLVKFARHVPSLENAERAYAAARQFVEATRPQPEVARAAA